MGPVHQSARWRACVGVEYGGLHKSSHLPLSESRRSELCKRTEKTRGIVIGCYAVTGEKFQDGSQTAADSFGNGDGTK